eukprot:GHVP01031223.1.p1 GENE.GHVP01031223.1~~GHVP01031223.1.p1  ORF type:complete len:339 (-),score=51.42 GHVP01031223.1:115-1131(-)
MRYVWPLVMSGLMLPVCILGILAFTLIFPFETPSFLINQEKEQKARDTLLYLRGANDVEEEINELQVILNPNSKEAESVGAKELFTSWEVAYPVIVGGLLAFFNVFTGASAFSVLSSFLFLEAGLSERTATNLGVLVAILKTILTFCSIFIIDRLGRKVLLTFGTSVQLASILPGAIGLLVDPDSRATKYLTVIGTLTFHIGYSFGYGPVSFVYFFELFPANMKAFGAKICLLVVWVSNIVLFFITPRLTTNFTFYFYSVMNILGLLHIVFMVRETKGLAIGESPYERRVSLSASIVEKQDYSMDSEEMAMRLDKLQDYSPKERTNSKEFGDSKHFAD